MKKLVYFSFLGVFAFSICPIRAQSVPPAQSRKLPIYGEVGLGFGQTLFFGDIKDKLKASLGGGFDPGTGNSLMMGFYVAPENWKGLGVGMRIKGTFGAPVKGDVGDQYIFNFYNVSVSGKYYPFSQRFNKGLYARGSVGFGQLTTKRLNDDQKLYVHQYAIGSSLVGGIGYTIPFKRTSLNIDAEFDYSNRNGTISGKGDGQTFQSGQLGINASITF